MGVSPTGAGWIIWKSGISQAPISPKLLGQTIPRDLQLSATYHISNFHRVGLRQLPQRAVPLHARHEVVHRFRPGVTNEPSGDLSCTQRGWVQTWSPNTMSVANDLRGRSIKVSSKVRQCSGIKQNVRMGITILCYQRGVPFGFARAVDQLPSCSYQDGKRCWC